MRREAGAVGDSLGISERVPASSNSRSTEGGRASGRATADGAMPIARTAMLDAAERLFAEHGIHQVSTREILRASGQSNQSALTYHFGNRLQLIAAMLDRRNGFINDLRHQRLDRLVAQGHAHDLRALIEAVVTSVTDVIRREAWGRDFVLTSVQVLLDPQLPEIEALLDASRRSAYAQAVGLLRSVVPTLPESVFEARMRMLGLGLSTSLAKWLRANGSVNASNAEHYETMVRDNIDYMVGGFSMPVGKRRSRGKR
jgi:AcrR family transcriptional regulator